jgi:hypothetical protein
MNRLDYVVGTAGWTFAFDVLDAAGKMVRGHLTICGITKSNAGESDKEEEPLKSAVSDALKRAAVMFGISRYLYYLPPIWADYDPQKRRFAEPPQIPKQAIERALSLCGWEATPTAPTREERREPQAPKVEPAPEEAPVPATQAEREGAVAVRTLKQRALDAYKALGLPQERGAFPAHILKMLGRTETAGAQAPDLSAITHSQWDHVVRCLERDVRDHERARERSSTA